MIKIHPTAIIDTDIANIGQMCVYAHILVF